MPKWVYFLIGVSAAVIAFQRIGSIYGSNTFQITAFQLFTTPLQTTPLEMPWAILYGLRSSGQEIANGLVALAFGIISSMGFYLSAKR